MVIRKASPSDIDGIMGLYERVKLERTQLGNRRYETRIQKRGFLLGLDNRKTYKSLIREARIFLVAEEGGRIIGYIIADHREKYYDDEYKTWFDLKLKDVYYRDPKAMSISHIAVDPDFSGKGIATALLQKLEEELKDQGFKHLYSIITLAPVTNCPTIIWHTKNDFRRIAMGRPRETLFNLEWYVGVLLHKSLETNL